MGQKAGSDGVYQPDKVGFSFREEDTDA